MVGDMRVLLAVVCASVVSRVSKEYLASEGVLMRHCKQSAQYNIACTDLNQEVSKRSAPSIDKD